MAQANKECGGVPGAGVVAHGGRHSLHLVMLLRLRRALLRHLPTSKRERHPWAHGRGVDAAVVHALLPVRVQPRQQAHLRGYLPVLGLRLRPLRRRVPGVPHRPCGQSRRARILRSDSSGVDAAPVERLCTPC
ncbi:hypothetical protein HU200_045211 [Digitaria exilis]|uniref:Uncharacterized protein n=1 Tax=Digitaria exilis TaxID=1010633 RepID=A0A835AXT1_9POAL|nr:hypothetical protein HU200_045211 [Digitaria exilis]